MPPSARLSPRCPSFPPTARLTHPRACLVLGQPGVQPLDLCTGAYIVRINRIDFEYYRVTVRMIGLDGCTGVCYNWMADVVVVVRAMSRTHDWARPDSAGVHDQALTAPFPSVGS